MENENKVTIIIPAYNAGDTILSTVNTVLSQNFTSYELIIVNDGSTDNTSEILSSFNSRSNVRIIHQENKGVSSARNIGIDEAKGDYIVFLDADDRLYSDSLKVLYQAIIDSNADICSANHSTCKEGANDIAAGPLDKTVVNGQGMLKLCLKDFITTHHVWATIFKKSFIGDTRFREDCIVHEDSFFMAELAMKEPVYSIINAVVYQYHISAYSVSRSKFSSRKADDILRLAREINDRIQKNYPQLQNLAGNYMIKAYMSILKNCPESSMEQQCLAYVRKNKRYFIPDSLMDKKLFTLIRYHLYWIYKLAYRIRFQ